MQQKTWKMSLEGPTFPLPTSPSFCLPFPSLSLLIFLSFAYPLFLPLFLPTIALFCFCLVHSEMHSYAR